MSISEYHAQSIKSIQHTKLQNHYTTIDMLHGFIKNIAISTAIGLSGTDQKNIMHIGSPRIYPINKV